MCDMLLIDVDKEIKEINRKECVIYSESELFDSCKYKERAVDTWFIYAY